MCTLEALNDNKIIIPARFVIKKSKSNVKSMYLFTRAAVTKYHTDWVANNRNLFSHRPRG